jgi:hypothetical protein
VKDAERLGRSRSAKIEAIIKIVLEFVERDLSTSEASAEVIAYNTNISTSLALRILKENKYGKFKPVIKSGLSIEMREARLYFCLAHEHWTLEMWKLVIWFDETSVVLGQRRGQRRVWRQKEQKFAKRKVRKRWKGFKEFMFWDCFTYDLKGPCHIWEDETGAEKAAAKAKLNALN